MSEKIQQPEDQDAKILRDINDAISVLVSRMSVAEVRMFNGESRFQGKGNDLASLAYKLVEVRDGIRALTTIPKVKKVGSLALWTAPDIEVPPPAKETEVDPRQLLRDIHGILYRQTGLMAALGMDRELLYRSLTAKSVMSMEQFCSLLEKQAEAGILEVETLTDKKDVVVRLSARTRTAMDQRRRTQRTRKK